MQRVIIEILDSGCVVEKEVDGEIVHRAVSTLKSHQLWKVLREVIDVEYAPSQEKKLKENKTKRTQL
jgi:hypothetical protein